MSTTYRISEDIDAEESSGRVCVGVVKETRYDGEFTYSSYMDSTALRTAIIKMIEVLSYISDDPEEVLRRFNVDYGDTK